MTGTKLKIRLFGDPVLRKKARRLAQVRQEQRDILHEMAGLMYASSGIGLAAPQVGINQAMIIADIGQGLYKLINPRITEKEGRQALEEGCLSVPGACIKVKRAKRITVEAQDENGSPLAIEAEDLLACVFQHEIDHLSGKLIVDYASVLERLRLKRKLRELKKRCRRENLPESKDKSCKLQL